MWRNYLTVGLRALTRNRTYAFINVFGLALGLAACLLLLVYVRYETSYENWQEGSDRVFQVQATWHEVGQPTAANQTSPFPVHETIAGGFPQIESVSIAYPARSVAVRDGEPLYVDSLIVDPSFLDMFRFDFIHGSARTALPNVNAMIVTESEANRLFGTTEAMGRTLTFGSGENAQEVTVTAVIRDLPRNTHLDFDALFRFDHAGYGEAVPPENRDWGSMNQYHYVKLRRGADIDAINAALPAWERRVIPRETVEGRTSSRADIMDLKLVAISDVHLGEAQLGAMSPGNDRRTVATFAIVAVLILVMACINFVNLSTARAGQRAREVALRKVVGASRRQLIVQFLSESVLVAVLAMLIALALVELALPWVSSWLDADLRMYYLGADGFLPHILALTLVVGAAGGLYPAFFLSRFQPSHVLKANKASAETQGSGRLRMALVVAQFAISIGLIASTWVIYSQTEYVQTVDPGYEREGLIQVPGGWRFEAQGNWESAKRAFAAVPGVTAVARTNLGVAATNKTILLVSAEGAAEGLNIGFYRVDPDFFETMGMRLLAGRRLGERFANDLVIRPEPPAEGAPAAPVQGPTLAERGLNIVVNRRAAEMLGSRDPAAAIGRQVRVGVDGGDMVPSTIVGVVENTRMRTARDQIEPIIFSYDPTRASLLLLRYRSSDPTAVMAGIGTVWRRFVPDAPFEGAFAEDLVAEQYERERSRGMVFAGFSLLAVIISCLGLFGLAAFTAERRTKEIGLRKVLGARIRHIVQLLAWQFSKPVVIANLIAWPVAWWAMRDWLNTFDTRIDLGVTPFVLAGLLALVIALGTIAGHAFKVARANPIHALRYE
jgi:putative ABC transport system permease protein